MMADASTLEAGRGLDDRLLTHAIGIGFKRPHYTVSPGAEKGDNFISIVSLITIEDHEDETKHLNIVIKTATSDECAREELGIPVLFSREVWTYRRLLPLFKDIKVDHEAVELVIPDCIIASDESKKELLALEDMSVKGFVLHRPRVEALDRAHVEAALAAIAHFHALSFVLKARKPDVLNELKLQVPDVVFPANTESPFKSYVEKSSQRALDVLTDRHHRDKIEGIRNNLIDILVEVVKPNKYAVFCHGDYWKNNMLFKYQNDTPVAVCPLDYQVLRFSSPATDILYLIFCCTTQQERADHYNQFLHHYHNELCSQFSKYGLPEDTFPLSEFLSEVQRCGVYGLGTAMNQLIFMTCSADNIPDARDIVNGSFLVDPSGVYADRMRGIVADCIAYGYI